MTVMMNYLWPYKASVQPKPFCIRNASRSRRVSYRTIESFFEDKFNVPARLLPSGRATLSLILRFLGADRSHVIFAPKWSSDCVWDAIGLRSNPTISFHPEPNYILAVHKWGFQSSLCRPHSGLIIEDSVDSLLTDGAPLFALGSEFNFISLPKVIGSYSGAIVFSHNESFLQFVRDEQENNAELALRQSHIKHRIYDGEQEPFESINPFEFFNTQLENNELQHIEFSLQNYSLNLETIKRRLDKLKQRFPNALIPDPKARFPIHFPAPKNVYFSTSKAGYMERFFDVRRQLDSPEYQSCYLLPLHIGVDEVFFEYLLSKLQVK